MLAPEVFKASDSLGWIYPFWQAKRKDEVSTSEVKIGADELPTVFALAPGSLAGAGQPGPNGCRDKRGR